MAAAFALEAEGVQIGSRFAVSQESSAHDNFKNMIIDAAEGDTRLALKKLTPVRLLNNDFSKRITELENNGASFEILQKELGKGRAKKGMFEGDTIEGELEIGQVSAIIDKVLSVKEIINEIIDEFYKTTKRLSLF
jgi:enoyl-[acyl-carrier protein] reductase II